jgi:hypothetical protein
VKFAFEELEVHHPRCFAAQLAVPQLPLLLLLLLLTSMKCVGQSAQRPLPLCSSYYEAPTGVNKHDRAFVCTTDTHT